MRAGLNCVSKLSIDIHFVDSEINLNVIKDGDLETDQIVSTLQDDLCSEATYCIIN